MYFYKLNKLLHF